MLGHLGNVVQKLLVVTGTSAPGGRCSSHLFRGYADSGRLFTTHSNFPELRLGPEATGVLFGEKEEERLTAEVRGGDGDLSSQGGVSLRLGHPWDGAGWVVLRGV